MIIDHRCTICGHLSTSNDTPAGQHPVRCGHIIECGTRGHVCRWGPPEAVDQYLPDGTLDPEIRSPGQPTYGGGSPLLMASRLCTCTDCKELYGELTGVSA